MVHHQISGGDEKNSMATYARNHLTPLILKKKKNMHFICEVDRKQF